METDFRVCLERGIEHFNRREFFEAHEVWEDAWRAHEGDDALFLQGLIQVAAGFVKLQRGQPRGAAALLDRAATKLEPFSPGLHGVDLAGLIASAGHWKTVADRMIETGEREFDRSDLPRLVLNPTDS